MDQCVLKLYVAGHTDRSESAISNLRRIAEDHLRGQCKLIIIDLLERPQFAKEGKILATPTLIKESPAPARRIVGDFADLEKVMLSLDLRGGSGNSDRAGGQHDGAHAVLQDQEA